MTFTERFDAKVDAWVQKHPSSPLLTVVSGALLLAALVVIPVEIAIDKFKLWRGK